MRALTVLCLTLLFGCLVSCERKVSPQEDRFVFVKSYCARVTVGGYVGITEKCFNIGDTVVGKVVTQGQVNIRIAGHSILNEGPPSPNNYQEYLNVPSDYLILIKE
jgi:hypothetical protein